MRPQRKFSPILFTLLGVAASSLMLAQEPPRGTPPTATPNEPVAGQSGRWRRVDAAPTDESQQPSPGDGPVMETPQNRPMPVGPAPGQIVIPAGTWITVRVDQLLSSKYNRPGDAFGATLAQPIIADGYVVARRGQTITGRVADVAPAGRVKGTSHLGVELSELGLADGQQVPVRTQLVEFSAGPSNGNDVAVIGTTTGVGAAIGAAAGGGFGAGMGAIAGAGASAIGVLLSRGRATEVPPESVMKFRLTEPATISTERAQHAFQPVQQADFESRPLQRRASVVRQPSYWGWGGGPFFYDPWMWGPGYYGWGPGWYGPRYYNSVFIGGRVGGWGGGGWGRGGGGRRR